MIYELLPRARLLQDGVGPDVSFSKRNALPKRILPRQLTMLNITNNDYSEELKTHILSQHNTSRGLDVIIIISFYAWRRHWSIAAPGYSLKRAGQQRCFCHPKPAYQLYSRQGHCPKAFAIVALSVCAGVSDMALNTSIKLDSPQDSRPGDNPMPPSKPWLRGKHENEKPSWQERSKHKDWNKIDRRYGKERVEEYRHTTILDLHSQS